ncbi:hypothetical protein O181_133871 [Austropuccinia psidii MF-1]|uniref:Uncharacterized protein n=1 Tax=Austropuccinia psidii MF-1 TaxID=1389203 RepID=A0A9Q3QCE4_9BASI|nr:hypothetical protein [Austropuccinia psidii MF-1]
MVTISPSSNVLSPSPSFIGRIITSLRSRSEVTIGWWPRRGSGQIDTGGDRANRPESFPLACLGARRPFTLGNGFIIVDHKGVLARASWARTRLASWSEGADNERTFLVCLSASITSVVRRRGTNAGDTPLGA